VRRATIRLLLLVLAPALAGAAGPGDGARIGEAPSSREGVQVAGDARAAHGIGARPDQQVPDGAAGDEPGS